MRTRKLERGAFPPHLWKVIIFWMGAMTSWNEAEELRREAVGKSLERSERLNELEQKVRRGFWSKLKALGRHLPFVEDLIAAYYCALDPTTPTRVRAMLLAALAYFILPFDFIPDMLPVIGYADDAALLAATIALVSSHITPVHRAAAARALDKELPKQE
jgi:uncharacterized membrane protein YkvA (DUF1232 family)